MSKPNVLVVDAGLGNIGSVIAALNRHNCTVDRLINPPNNEQELQYSHLILPGVGSFKSGMKALREKGWDEWIIQQWCPLKRPLLGICLGMQLLASSGTEGTHSGEDATQGLDLIPGVVKEIKKNKTLALPHVGWNEVTWKNTDEGLSDGLPDDGDFYFVHSYAFIPKSSNHILAKTYYGQAVTAAVGRGQHFGVQFHPEKSQKLGKHMVNNFLNL